MLDELPALDKLVSQFFVKYGEEFVANATMCKADCGVMEQVLCESFCALHTFLFCVDQTSYIISIADARVAVSCKPTC
jgi:hypothetical protein